MLELDNETESDALDEDEDEYDDELPNPKKTRKRSFVWEYFKEVPDNPNSQTCRLCNLTFANKAANLGRHLETVHDIKGRVKSTRRTSSFIWRYCTRVNDKQALCRLCNKVFYFGGGNTTNMVKHLRRKHAESIEYYVPESPKKIRKTTSFVWNHATKLPNNRVRCTICMSVMSFHGTANLMKHLNIHKIVGDKTSPTHSAKSTDPLPSTLNYSNVSNSQILCELCDKRFEQKHGADEEIAAHMKAYHNMELPAETPRINSTEVFGDDHDKDHRIWQQDNEEEPLSIADQHDDEALYNALIEEDQDGSENLATTLDSEATTSTIENPPSTESINNIEDPDQDDEEDLIPIEESETSPDMRHLKEELLRQQTNYFNEKAGYYRMQKYLVALQVRRERLEIEMLTKKQNKPMRP